MSDGLAALLHVLSHDVSWLASFLLVCLPFAYADLAIVLGAYVVVNAIVPVAPAALCIYAGMVASDIALYGIGAGALELPWLKRLALDARTRNFANLLDRDLLGVLALGRAVPGVAHVAFIACGAMRVPLTRFIAASLFVSALYLPVMLCLMVFFGGALDARIGAWTWPVLLAMVIAMELVRRRVFGFHDAEARATAAEPAAHRAQPQRITQLEPKPLSARPAARGPRWRSLNARPEDAVTGTAATPN